MASASGVGAVAVAVAVGGAAMGYAAVVWIVTY